MARDATEAPVHPRWNGNIEYHRVVVDHLSEGGPHRVLDVGCGAGVLSGELVAEGHDVTGIDRHAPSLALARAEVAGTFVQGDFLTHPFPPASFDAVVGVAVLHHVPSLDVALRRICDLLRPGGRFATVGLAAGAWRDNPHRAAACVVGPWIRRGRPVWRHPSPMVWPPPTTFRQARAIYRRCMPGHHWRRHWLGRYTVTWIRPVDS